MAYVISDDCIACGTCIDECPVGVFLNGFHPLFCVIGKLDFIGQPLSALGHFCFKLRLLGLCLFQHGVEFCSLIRPAIISS